MIGDASKTNRVQRPASQPAPRQNEITFKEEGCDLLEECTVMWQRN